MNDVQPAFSVQRLDFYYGPTKALGNINLNILPKKVTALIGPSGCGKSTFLRCLNRMNDTIPGARAEGSIKLDGDDVLDPAFNVVDLRQRVGMVFQKPNPFPQSIYDNVAFGPRALQMKVDSLDYLIEQSLRDAALWDDAKDKLKGPALDLSLGQQQRLCIARVLAVKPEVILMDEPCSALDSESTRSIEELMLALADRYTIDREIGAGGMATVYLAHDLRHDRNVALKVLKPDLGAVLGVERFLSEIKVTANLQHLLHHRQAGDDLLQIHHALRLTAHVHPAVLHFCEPRLYLWRIKRGADD